MAVRKKETKGKTSKINTKLVWAILIPTALLLTIGITIASLSIGEIEGLANIHFSISNGGSFDDVTANYSVTAYTYNKSDVLDNSSFEFYKEWIVGTNGSAVDAVLDMNEINASDAFVVRFRTNMSGYDTWGDFSYVITENKVEKYSLFVYEDPDVFNVTVETSPFSGNTSWTKVELEFDIGNDIKDGYARCWQPQIYNTILSDLTVNVTADAVQTFGFIQGLSYSDPLAQVVLQPTNITDTSILRFLGVLQAPESSIDNFRMIFYYDNTVASVTDLTFIYSGVNLQSVVV